MFFMFTPIRGRFSPILTVAYFSDGLGKNHQPVLVEVKIPDMKSVFIPPCQNCLLYRHLFEKPRFFSGGGGTPKKKPTVFGFERPGNFDSLEKS